MEDKFDTLTTELRSLLGDRCSTGDSIIDLHSRDAAYTPPVKPHVVVFPENTEEVSSIVKLCSEKNCPRCNNRLELVENKETYFGKPWWCVPCQWQFSEEDLSKVKHDSLEEE